MQKITPFLWFDGQAFEAASLYTSIFPRSSMTRVSRQGDPDSGKVMSVSFQLEGQDFIAFNGGPMFKFTQAISLFVSCQDQAEIDHLWERLGDGGQPSRCGWVTDRFGVSWQVTPQILGELMQDPVHGRDVAAAMMAMTKFDIAALKAAAQPDGEVEV